MPLKITQLLQLLLIALLLFASQTASSQSAIAVADFSSGSSGWKFAGRNLHDESVSDSALSIEDDGDELWYFSAPASFIGDKSSAFQGTLSYTIGHFLSNALGRPPLDSHDVLLSCDDLDMTLGISDLVPHWTMDKHVIVHLDDRAAWRDIRTDQLATNSDIRACLAALDALLLRGSFYAGPERTFLKNVTLTGSHSSASVIDTFSTVSSTKTSSPIQTDSSTSRDHLVMQLVESQAMAQLRSLLEVEKEATSKAELQIQVLSLDLAQARAEVLRLLQKEQQAQSDTSMCTHSLTKCENSLMELRALNAQTMERLHQADGLRLRKQLELERNKGACVPAAEVQGIEANLQSAVAIIRQANESLSASVAHSDNLTKQLQVCRTKASIAELRAHAVVEGGEAIAHVVQALKETLITVERSFNESKSSALREAADCYAALHVAHTRGILTVFLTYVGPCFLSPVAMFVLIVCNGGSATPSRTWMLVSKSLLLAAYTSWIIPHIMDLSMLSVQTSTAHSGVLLTWAQILSENVYTHVSPSLLAYLPRSPAQYFIVGSCSFAMALAVQGCVAISEPSPSLVMDSVITWSTGLHFMFVHGWGGDTSMDLSNGNEMMLWYSVAFVMSSLLHVFGRASPDSRNVDIKKLDRKKRNTKRFLLRALESWTDRTSGGTADMNSSDAEKGVEGEGSSIDEDDGTLQSTRGDKQRKLLPTSPHTLPSSLMRALTIPPPSPSSMTSEDFIRDFLSKYPPSPKSYELSIGNKVRRLSKQFARDAPSLLLLEGEGMEDRPGCSEKQWIEHVCQWVLLHAGTNADTVFDIANQNLGIFCYEHVVKAFGNGGNVIVKQVGDHAIALEADASSAAISFASSFLLLDSGQVEGPQLKVSVTAMINLGRKKAELIVSPATSMHARK